MVICECLQSASRSEGICKLAIKRLQWRIGVEMLEWVRMDQIRQLSRGLLPSHHEASWMKCCKRRLLRLLWYDGTDKGSRELEGDISVSCCYHCLPSSHGMMLWWGFQFYWIVVNLASCAVTWIGRNGGIWVNGSGWAGCMWKLKKALYDSNET